VSDSETPSMLSGKPPVSKRAKASAAKLETVVDSPEPQPAKKLMFTPATVDNNGGKSKKSGVQFDNTVASTPAASSKATARATSTRRSKRGSENEVDEDDDRNTTETPVANGNGEASAKKSAKKEKTSNVAMGEQEEEPAAVTKSAKKESAKKSAKKEKASTVVDAEGEVEPTASAENPKQETKSAKKSAKKEAKASGATPKGKRVEEAAAAAAPSSGEAGREDEATATTAAKSAKKSSKKAEKPSIAAMEVDVDTVAERPEVELTKAEKKKLRKRAAKARKVLAEARAANPAGALAQADPSRWHLKVHRCRFAGWMPDPIHCLAATPAAWGANRVAVARSGGDLELVHVDERWAVEARVAGPPMPRQTSDKLAAEGTGGDSAGSGGALSVEGTANSGDVRALCWVNGALVGGTLGGLLFAADFAQGVRTRQTDALGGAVWALATPPPVEDPSTSDGNGRSANGASAFEKDRHELVAAGCEDGTVRIFRVVHDDDDFLGGSGGGGGNGQRSFEYVKTLGSVGARVTSLAWAPPFDSEDGSRSQRLMGPLFAGTADGTIHRFDVAAGRGTARMTLERRGTATGSGAATTGHPYGDDGDAQWSVVWALLALRDGTIVSGDSSGCVQFWDGVQCAHVARQETHAADVLCLAASADQLSLFASGIDHKVVCLRRLGSSSRSVSNGGAFGDDNTLGGSSNSSNGNRGSGKGASNGVWSLVHAYRAHQLDVRALAIVQLSKTTAPEHNSVPAAAIAASVARTGRVTREILVSGGLDTKLCTYHVRHFTEHRPKRIWPFPYHSVVALAAAPRLVLAQHRDKLCLWKLPSSTAAATAATQPDSTPEIDSAKAVAAAAVGAGNGAGGTKNETHRLLLEVTLKAASALVCSAIAPDGHWLAVSDTARLRVFRIHGSSGKAAAAAAAKASANGSSGKASVAEEWLSSGDVRLEQLKLPASCAAPCQKLCFASLGSGGSGGSVGSGGGARLVCGTQSGLLQVLALTATSPPVASAPASGGGAVKTTTAHAELEHCFRFNEDTVPSGRNGAGDDDSDDDDDDNVGSGDSNGKSTSVSEEAWKVFGASGQSSLPFSALAVSPDGQWLAAAGCRNALAVYSLDRNGLFWLPPRPPARISSLAFHPSCGGSGLLAAACVDNRFHLFEVEARRLADW